MERVTQSVQFAVFRQKSKQFNNQWNILSGAISRVGAGRSFGTGQKMESGDNSQPMEDDKTMTNLAVTQKVTAEDR